MTQQAIPVGIDQALLFFQILYSNIPSNSYIGLSTIRKGQKTIENVVFDLARQDRLLHRIATREDRYNVFLRVTPLKLRPSEGKRGSRADSAGSHVLWTDIDIYNSKTLEPTELQRRKADVITALNSLPQKPTVIVDSGYGIHAYWRLSLFEPDFHVIEAKNRAIQVALSQLLQFDINKADSVYDAARIMRVPGSYNVKNGSPKPVTILEYNPTNIYDITMFPDVAVPVRDSLDELTDVNIDELPVDFLDTIQAKDKKLFARIKSDTSAIKAGVEITNNDEIDHSRNDMYIALRLFGLGYSAGVVAAVLTHDDWLSGEKYRTTLRWDYVQTTIENAFRKWQESPDRFFAGKAFQSTVMARDITKRQPIIYTAGKLWRYIDGVYCGDGDQFVRNHVQRTLGSRWTSHNANETVIWFQDAYPVDIEKTNQHSSLVNCLNGMLDTKTQEIKPHDQAYLSLAQINAKYDPNINTVAIDTFIHQILPSDAVDTFWEYVGSAFVTEQYWPKCFLALIGLPNSGKSKVLELLLKFYGLVNCTAISFQALADNKFATADLFGKLANIFSDVGEGEAQNPDKIKGLTGDDYSFGEHKFRPMFKFKNTARLFFSANQLPTVRSPDEAFFIRSLVIPCPNVFTDETADKAIVSKLTTPDNMSAVLLRASQGLQRLLASNKLTFSVSIKKLQTEYRLTADTTFGFFADATVEDQTVSGIVTKQLMYKYYERWCQRGNRRAFSQDKFFKRVTDNMTALGLREMYHSIEGEQRWCYVGRRVTMRNETLIFS